MTEDSSATSQKLEDQVDDRPAPATEWPELSDPDMLARIKQIIEKEGMVPEASVVPTATLESLGLESIDVASILMGVEEEFDVYIPMSTELAEARNLSELIDVIVAQMTPDEVALVNPNS